MNSPVNQGKAGEIINGDDKEKACDQGRRKKTQGDRNQIREVGKLYHAGLGTRVEILDIVPVAGRIRCRRLMDGKEIMVPMADLAQVARTTPADEPRELFKHEVPWRDPGDDEISM